THCARSGQVGNFIITGERSIGSGMRRIEAVTGDGADALMDERFRLLDQAAEAAGARTPDRIVERIQALAQRSSRTKAASAPSDGAPQIGAIARSAESVDGTRFVAYAHPFDSMEDLKAFAKDLRGALGDGVIALALESDEPQIFVTVSDDLVKRGVSAGRLVQAGAPIMNGKGGGRPEMAQARGSRRDRVPSPLEAIPHALSSSLDTRA